MRCKDCGSTNVTVDTQQTSKYSWGKGLLGALVFGALGAVAGVGGKTETTTNYHCMACGAIGGFYSVVMDANTESEIMFAFQRNDVAKLNGLKKKYRNIEWTPPVEPAPTHSTPILPQATPQSSAPISNTTKPSLPLEKFKIYRGVLKYFSGTKADVTIPQGVVSIGDHAFDLCKSLTSVSIPDSVTSIGNHAFDWCENLTSVSIPDSVTSIGDYAFAWCKSLTSISIPDSVTSIGDCAFERCRLTSIKIPGSVTSIGKRTFYSNVFSSITIPKSIHVINREAFACCRSLNSVIFQDPYGWAYKLKNKEYEPIDEAILSNPESAAEFIKDIGAKSILRKKAVKNKEKNS